MAAAARKLYYDLRIPAGMSTLSRLQAAARQRKHGMSLTGWLENQDAYTLHRPVRKRFQRNPSTVNDIMDVWEYDLLDVQRFSKYNDGVRYLLSIIDIFSKYLHVMPLKSKAGPYVMSSFMSVLNEPRYSKPVRRRPLLVQTDIGK